MEPLSGPTQTLPALYSLPASDFHDETIGYNFYNAGTGYDLVTGRGSPIANKLIPDLADYGAATSATIEYQPPSSVQAGGVFGTVVEALDAKGNLAYGFGGSATISMVSGPAGATFTPETVQMSGGMGVIDGLTLNIVSSTPYVFQISVLAGKNPFMNLTTDPVTVTPAAPTGTGVFYPLPVGVSVRSDFTAAGANSDSINNLLLVYDANYDVSGGQIVLQNTSQLGNKTINVTGMGEGKSVFNAGGQNRDFEILGMIAGGFNNLSVFFNNLTISGGTAKDAGGLLLATGSGVGGGVLMDGGMVSMSKVSMESNEAQGATGSTGFVGASVTGGPGGPGGAGGHRPGRRNLPGCGIADSYQRLDHWKHSHRRIRRYWRLGRPGRHADAVRQLLFPAPGARR